MGYKPAANTTSVLARIRCNEEVPLDDLLSALTSPCWLTREASLTTLAGALETNQCREMRSQFQVSAFTLFTQDPIKLVRLAAQKALVRNYIDRTLLQEQLLEVLRSTHVKRRSRCLELVAQVFSPPSAIDDLLPALIVDSSARVREEAVKVAARYSNDFIPFIVKRLSDDDPRVRNAALLCLNGLTSVDENAPL